MVWEIWPPKMPSSKVRSCCVALQTTSDSRNIELAGYAWENLPEGSLVVDVGGGVGAQSLTLATKFPQLHFVVQDREPVVRDAVEVRDYSPNMLCFLIKYGPCRHSSGRRTCLRHSNPAA